MLLVNLETGETLDVDEERIRELGLPDGFHVANTVSAEEWIATMKRLHEGQGEAPDEVEEPQVEVSLNVVRLMQKGLLQRAFKMALEKNPTATRYQIRAIKR